GTEALTGFRLGLSGPARISGDAAPVGGRLVHQLSNYAEIAPENGFALPPGEAWTIDFTSTEYDIPHWTQGPTAAFVIRANGTATLVQALPAADPEAEGRRLRGTMRLEGTPTAETPVAVLPWPRRLTIA